jgi:hypothetical protein
MKVSPIRTAWIVVLLFLAPDVYAATYYVRGDVGSDSNDGTSPSSAFKTIQKGAEMAQPGDTVEVYAGTYRERVKPPRGGTGENARITYMARPGDHVIITALDPWSPAWTANGGSYPNLYYATPPDPMFTDTNYVDGGNPFKITFWSTSNRSTGQVVVDGAEYTEKTSLSSANSAPQSWYVNRSNGRIYVNFGGSPSGHSVEIVTRRGVFRPYLKGLGYITVEGFDMAYCGNNACGPAASGLDASFQCGMVGTRQGHHWRIIGNRIRSAKGLALSFSQGVEGSSDASWWDPHGAIGFPFIRTQVEVDMVDPIAADNETDPTNSQLPSKPFKEVGFNIIANNSFESCGFNAIAGLGSVGNTIYGNRFTNNCRFINGDWAEDATIKMHLQYGDLIEKNLFENDNAHRALWLDNDVVGTVVSRNVFLNHTGGTPTVFFELASSLDQYLTVVDNNLFINCEHGVVSAVADGVAFFNNLFFRCGDGFAMGSNRTPMSGGDCGNMRIHAWNNVFVDQQRAFGFGFNQAVNFHTSDYNLMYRPSGVTYCKYLLTENGTGDGGDPSRTVRPWCTTNYTQADIRNARSGSGSYWSQGVDWGANNAPNGCESDLPYWKGTMGGDIDLHSVERPYPGSSYGSHTSRTITLSLGSDPSISGAPPRDGARFDIFGNLIGSPVKAGCFQDLGSGSSVFTFWDDANLPPLPALPAAPSNLQVSTVSSNTMQVTWDNNALDARFMHVERSINGGEWQFWGYITTTQNRMLDYADTIDTTANTYEYRVAARNAAGLSPFAYVQPVGPSLAIFLTSTNTVVVSWPLPTSTGWNLEQNDDLGSTNWVIPPQTVQNDGTNNFIILRPETSSAFYRLSKPLSL